MLAKLISKLAAWLFPRPNKWRDDRPMYYVGVTCHDETFIFLHDGKEDSRRKCCEIIADMVDDQTCAMNSRAGMAVIGCVLPMDQQQTVSSRNG